MNMDRGIAYKLALVVVPIVLLVGMPFFAFSGSSSWPVDIWFTQWVHSLQNPALSAVMNWVSAIAYHNVQFWIVGIVGVYFLVRRLQVLPTLALLATRYGSVWLGDVLKDLYARPRPQLEWLAKQSKSFSYPSGTVTIGATFYLMLAYLIANEFEDKRLRFSIQLAGWLFAGTISFSRIYLGAHWLTDTIAGLCVAATVTASLSWVLSLSMPQLPVFRSLARVAAAEMRKRK